MRTLHSHLLPAALTFALATAALAQSPQLPTLPFTGLTLVQEIDCGATPPAAESTPGSSTQTILTRNARVLLNPAGSPVRYFGYKIGQGLGLQPGRAYVLEVDYPEDGPRAMTICNGGEAAYRGLHTGVTVGDALTPPYVSNNSQSVNIPVSGQWQTWRSLFHLHDRFADLHRNRGDEIRPLLPADGFWVVIAQFANEDEPLSLGAAVSKIRLYEAPSFSTYDAALRLPPQGLPRRHLFVREEMADGIAGVFATTPESRGVPAVSFYEYKAREMKFLGMNTFTKDLLEFGGNQGFDSNPGGGNDWYFVSSNPTLWENILTMLGSYGLDVLPYYEYAGSEGAHGLGSEKRARPLAPNLTVYTQISWAESTRADLIDPDTLDDAKLLLDVTMTRFRHKVNFVGAWFRNRVSQMPISFSDNDFAWYAQEQMNGAPFTRAQMQTVKSLYNPYCDWWMAQRRDFVAGLRDHLRAEGVNKHAFVLYTSDASEPGKSPGVNPELIADDPVPWTNVGVDSVTPATALGRHRKALTTARGTYSGWEWQHADPWNDPAKYVGLEGAMLTMTFNKPYTLDEQPLIDEFKTAGGLAMVRHFSLNENTLDDPATTTVTEEPLGYFVADFERTGPFCMMGEAAAFAKGDPFYIGYLSSNTFSPGFPEYRRAFNKAYLALPAVQGTIRGGASSNVNVLARDYTTDGFGTYMGIVNNSTANQTATITLPFSAKVTDAATGTVISSSATTVVLTMYPYQLRALHLDKSTGARALDDTASVVEGNPVTVSVLGNDLGTGTLQVAGVGTAENGSVSISGTQVIYTPNPGFVGSDSFRYTLSDGAADQDKARVAVTVSSAATASDLSAWGLKDYSLGTDDTGSSRMLSTQGEVVGFGTGAAGTSDQGHFVARTVSGDFQAKVRVNSVSGASDALAGLMLRQSTDPASRMVAALAGPTGTIHLLSRSVKSDAVAGTTNASSGAIWLRFTRSGDLVRIEKSTNDSTYTEIGWRTFPGLPATLQIGLWGAGGDRYSGSRALLQNFTVTTTPDSAVKFIQNFSTGTAVSNYVDAGGAANTWANISADSMGGVWSIEPAGSLKLTGNTDTTSNNDAGYTRLAGFSLTPGVLKTSVSVGVSGVTGNYQSAGYLDWGNYASIVDYGSWTTTDKSNTYAVVNLKGKGDNAFQLDVEGVVGGNFVADGRLYNFTVYLNTSTSDTTYVGPDATTHTLQAGKITVWVDDAVIVENVTRNVAYTTAAPTHFKFRSTGGLGRSYWFDDYLIENRAAAPTPSHTNSTPVAVADSRSTAESTPITIDVLANDSDADAGPQGLKITGATGGNGTVAVSDGKVIYTPAAGYFGTNTLSYTISDGQASASANITVTVNSTSTASDLTSAQLTGASMGSAGSTDRSRILADGYWELQQTGGASSSSSDVMRWERKSVSGNFEAEFRVREFQTSGVGAAGLMIREGTSADARMAQLGVEGSYARARYRTAKGGAAVTGSTTAPLTLPAGWLQIFRFGDTLTLRTSADGQNFTDLQTVQIPGLAESVEVALFATNARMAGTGFIVRPYQRAYVNVDFNSSTSVASYVRELDPESNQLSDIGAESLGGTWSIDAGRLRIDRGTDTSSLSGAGFVRTTPFPGNPNILRMSFDLTIPNVNTSSDLLLFEFGNFPTVNDYNDSIVTAPIHSRMTVKGNGLNKFVFRVNGANQTATAYNAGAIALPVVTWTNNSGAAQSYRTPDGTLRSLADGCQSVWAGGSTGTLLFNSVSRGFTTTTTLSNFRMRVYAASYTAMLDNIVVDNDFVPNAAPIATNDVGSTPMGAAVDIPVLSNDADSDGPQALSVTGVGQGANGTASIVSGQIRYTPNAGFTGSDTLTYTVTDGQSVDWGTVQVSVTGSFAATDLTSGGLAATNIGTGTGSGAVMTYLNRVWQLNGSGAGLTGTADNFHGELATITGDFQLNVKLNSISGGTGRIGLVIREGTATGARMAAIGMGTDSIPRYSVRTATSGSVTETVVSGSWTAASTYLQLKREGSNLRVGISNNGLNFTQVLDQSISSLTSSVNAGLYVSGGTTAVVQTFAISRLRQGFETIGSAGTLTNFVITPSLATYLSNVSADLADGTGPGGGVWSVDSVNSGGSNYSGKLKLIRPANVSGPTNTGAGITRFAATGVAPQKAVLSFKITMNGVVSTSTQDIWILDSSTTTAWTDYNGSTPSVSVANRLQIKGGGTVGTYKFHINGINTQNYPADGTTELQVQWYLNQTGGLVNYRGPDGSAQSIQSATSDLWINGSKVLDDIARTTTISGPSFGGFRMRTSTLEPITAIIDDMDLQELP